MISYNFAQKLIPKKKKKKNQLSYLSISFWDGLKWKDERERKTESYKYYMWCNTKKDKR